MVACGVVASVAVILFAVFSFAGWLYETVDNVFTFGGLYLRASLMLPWCPIYGIGGLLIVALLEPLRQRLVARTTKPVEVVENRGKTPFLISYDYSTTTVCSSGLRSACSRDGLAFLLG